MGILDLITPSFVARVQIFTYSVLICFSFFIFIGAAVMKDKYDGCPLYADTRDKPGSDSNCDYPIAVSVMFQFVYLLFRMGLFVLAACGTIDADSVFFNDTWEFIFSVIDLISFFLTFVAACILAAGRNAACDECQEIGDWHPANNAAQAGAWISTLVWLFVGTCGFVCAFRGGKIPFIGGSPVSGTNIEGNNRSNRSQQYQDPIGP